MKTQVLCALGLASLLLLGCTHPRAWIYLPHASLGEPPRSTKPLLVPPFVDERRTENTNRVWCFVVPLCPYGWQELDQPERVTSHIHSGVWQFDPSYDLARALADEVSRAQLFSSVVVRRERDDPGHGFLLQGILVSTRYEATIVSYGLSALGSNLWFLGLPMGSMRETLAFRLRLEDRPSGRVYWERAYRTQQDDGWVSLYALPDDFSYDRLFQALIPTILKDLEQAIKDTRVTYSDR